MSTLINKLLYWDNFILNFKYHVKWAHSRAHYAVILYCAVQEPCYLQVSQISVLFHSLYFAKRKLQITIYGYRYIYSIDKLLSLFIIHSKDVQISTCWNSYNPKPSLHWDFKTFGQKYISDEDELITKYNSKCICDIH
jgi:hypothetical protein